MGHTTTCKKTSRASAPQGMGRALAPVGALPLISPEDSSLSPIRRTHKRRESTGNHTTKENNFPN